MKPKKQNPILRTLAFTTLLSLAFTGSAHAAKTWSGATDGLWATTTNWVEAALPGTTETVNFDASSTANLTISLGANRTVRGINFTSPSGNVVINANTLILNNDGTGIDMSAATADLTFGSAVQVYSALQKFDVAAGRTLSMPVPTHVNGANNATVGGLIRVGTTGTVKFGAAALANILDAGGNPFISYGDDQFAATDATGTVIAATNTAWNASIGATFPATPGDVTASFTQTGNGGFLGIRFADTTTAHTVTFAGSTTFTGRGILVAPNCAGATITGGSLRPNRSSTAGCVFSIFQNSTVGDLLINAGMGTASSGTPVGIAKAGLGKVIFGQNNGTNGRYFNYAGTMQFGNAGTTGAPNGTGEIVNYGTLIFDRTADLTITNPVQGTGVLVKNNTNILTLNSTSTYTGATTLNGGLVSIAAAANLGATSGITINGGGIQWTAAADISATPITISSGGATFDVATGVSEVLANTIGNSGTGAVTKTGAGSLTLGGANTYSGNTTVSAGTLTLSNTTGSATGSGATVSVATGAKIGGTGITTGAVTVSTGATVLPGDVATADAAGTLTTGDLTLDSGSAITFNVGGSSDLINSTGALTINGGAITLNQTGSNVAFATAGTYNIIQYTGSIGGAGETSLSVANPQAGFNYTFGTAGGFVTLTIAASGLVGDWIFDGSDSWNIAGDWSGGIPNGIGNVARFNTNLSAASNVTLDGTKTVGGIVFVSSPNGYTIDQGSGGSLILDNSTGNATIALNTGSHSITAPVILTDSVDINVVTAGTALTISGAVSGSGGITKIGAGDLVLSSSNSFAGNASLTGGVTTFVNGGLGNGTLLDLTDTTVKWEAGNTQDITTKTVTMTGTVQFDTNANDVTFANDITGTSNVVKLGDGILTIVDDASFTGITTITAGSLQLGNGGLTGSVSGDIINNSDLILNRIDTTPADISVNNVISGTGTLNHVGAGTTSLGGTNTFTGDTMIAAGGILKTGNPLALQGSTLVYDSTGGTLSFGLLSSATLGNINGDKNLVLENDSAGAVALTIGANNSSQIYSGIFSGAGSLTKTGTGTDYLMGINTYTGATTVNGGAGKLILDSSGGAITSSSSLTVAGGATFQQDGGSSSFSGASSVNNAGTVVSTFTQNGGTATFGSSFDALGNANVAFFINLNSGTFSAASMSLGRTALNYSAEPLLANANGGLYVNGADATITGDLGLGISALANSSVQVSVASGSLTVGGVTTIGLNNGGRWSILDVNGGTFTSTNVATGVVLGAATAGKSTFVVRNTGVAKVERIQFGQGAVIDTGVVNVYAGGELCIGTGGIVIGSTDPAYSATVKVADATLSACGDWSTTLPIALSGSVTLKAEDSTPTAHNMTLDGVLSGAASLVKTGAGTVTLSAANTYSGNTTVNAGTLSISNAYLADTSTVTIASGAAMNLNYTGTDTVDALIINGTPAAAGTWGATGSGATHIDDTHFTGTGTITVPSSGFAGWITGTFANGTVASGDQGPLADPDGDGLSNALEYAFDGNDPTVGNGSIGTISGNTVSFTKRALAVTNGDVTYAIEESTDLGLTDAWADVTPTVDNSTTISFDYTVGTKDFFRAKATIAP